MVQVESLNKNQLQYIPPRHMSTHPPMCQGSRARRGLLLLESAYICLFSKHDLSHCQKKLCSAARSRMAHTSLRSETEPTLILNATVSVLDPIRLQAAWPSLATCPHGQARQSGLWGCVLGNALRKSPCVGPVLPTTVRQLLLAVMSDVGNEAAPPSASGGRHGVYIYKSVSLLCPPTTLPPTRIL